jgi:hypothetical protein
MPALMKQLSSVWPISRVAQRHSETIRDLSDYEVHLLCLENCQAWLEDEYKKIAKDNPQMLPYEKVVR